MPRPKLSRTIQSPPAIEEFNPGGSEKTGEVMLSLEEYEAVRLSDYEGLDQSAAATQMGVSRQTFGRVLRAARFIVAKALVQGLQLKMGGGCYRVRGQGHHHGNGPAGRRRRGGCTDNMRDQMATNGGAQMANENNIPSQQPGNQENRNQQQGTGQGRGQGRGMGGGRGGGGGTGQGRGRGMGGGKGDGSCRRKK